MGFHRAQVVLLTLLVCHNSLFSQFMADSLPAPRQQIVKLMNGMMVVDKSITGAKEAEVTFYIKAGSVYENDSLSGVGYLVNQMIQQKLNTFLETQNKLEWKSFSYQSVSTTEHSIFHFQCSKDKLPVYLKLICDTVFRTSMTEDELDAAKDSEIAKLGLLKSNPTYQFEQKLLHYLYRQDHEKLTPVGNPAEYKNITWSVAKGFYERYYVANNTIVTITGDAPLEPVTKTFESIFDSIYRSDFNPETVTKMIHYRPMIYSIRLVEEDTSSQPELQFCWQFPGVNANERASYSGFLLATILNDYNNYIQVKARKLQCKKITATYEANNFSGILRVAVQPDKAHLPETFTFISDALSKLDQTLVNESMMMSGKINFGNWYDRISNTKLYTEQTARFWAYNDESYFPELRDSVRTITDKDFKHFIRDYMNENPHVTVLKISAEDKNALRIDTFFTALSNEVNDYVFRYRQNIVDIETAEDSFKLKNLLQWMKLNNDTYLQVNGFSDEGEYNHFRDDSVTVFLDSLPEFKRVTTEIVKGGNFRPDMMRALKILKYLYDNGITADRLTATGMKFTSDSREEEIENYKCTLTIKKQRKTPSLREVHYGLRPNN